MIWAEPEQYEFKERYKDINLLWSSNAIWGTTGYAIPSKAVLPRLMAMGIKCTQFAWYGLEGSSLSFPLIPDHPNGMLDILPRAVDPYGFDIIGAYADVTNADLVLSLHDIWIMPDDYGERLEGRPWAAWMPVDMEPCPPQIAKPAKACDYPLVYSKWGTKLAQAAGVEKAQYMPMGADCNLYRPMDRAQARQRFPEFDQGDFVIGMVAANKGDDCRKGFPEMLLAFAEFHRAHPDARLYLHTKTTGGIEIDDVMAAIPDFPRDRVQVPNQVAMRMGMSEEYLANAYNAMDVLIQPSSTEGFGIPIIEAQACGTPVIVNGCTSMPEIAGDGWIMEPGPPQWLRRGVGVCGWVHRPQVGEILDKLEECYAQSKGEKGRQWLREQAREFAVTFHWDKLIQEYWIPLWDRIAKDLGKEVRG